MAVPSNLAEKTSSSLALFRNAFKKINLREQNAAVADSIVKEYKVSEIAGRILAARGFQANEPLKNFLFPTLRSGLPAPSELKNLDRACTLIAEFVKAKKQIAICCDFDVDGLSGGSQVYHFLRSIGALVQIFVPDRFTDGYGLNAKTIEQLAQEKYGLLITVDFGTTNVKELELAHSLGLKTVVIDHHHVNTNPPADVFVNPKQKGCGFAGEIMCAAGLAWYLVMGLSKKVDLPSQIDVKDYLDLACLGTICDMVPLIGANRILARRGLELLERTNRVGLQALKEQAGIKGAVGCSDVSFGIGPRLNAAGRLIHAEVVIDLLTTSDSIKAGKIARKLNKLNADRQAIEQRIKEDAVKLVEAKGYLPDGIAVWNEKFHTGVIGIVAQRLVENFYRPSAVMGRDAEGIYKGSVRGIKGFSVVDALGAVGEHLLKFGGHEGAGGFSVEESKLEKFVAAFEKECTKRLKKLQTEPIVEADTEVTLSDIGIPLVNELKGFAPFGIGNPQPILLLKDLKVTEVKQLKGAHLKVMLSDGKRFMQGLMWRCAEHPALSVGSKVSVAARPDINSYNGNSEVQLTLVAAEPA